MRLSCLPLLAVPIVAASQGSSAPVAPTAPVVLSRAEEVRLARSAAPAAVSANARVYVLRDGRYVVGAEGSSGASCLVSRSQPLSLEPECGDAEAEATVLTVERFRVEQRLAGHSSADVDRAVGDSLASGYFRVPRRPAMVYMMSSAQILYNEQGKFVGRWMPHTMLYYPFLQPGEIGLAPGTTDLKAPMIDKPGTPWSNIMTVVRAFVDPAPAP